MAAANELTLAWQGGLNTSRHEAYIGESELSDMSNAIVRDGAGRLDQRYILAAEQASGNLTPRGSGWGKYSTGPQSEQYCVVLGTTMYLIDLTTTLAFTAVGGATGLNASNWWFQQFENYIYAANAVTGIGRKKLFTGSNGTGDWSLIAVPTAPTVAPGAALSSSFYYESDFTGGTTANTGLSSATITDDQLVLVSAGGGPKTATVTLDTSPDERIDAEYRDIFAVAVSGSPSNANYGNLRVTIFEGGNEYESIPWSAPAISGANILYFRLQNVSRANRNQITAVKFAYEAPAGASTLTISSPNFYGVWLSLESSVTPPAWPNAVPLKELVYEYTYYNSTTGFESAPSPAITVPVSEQGLFGEWRDLTASTTGASGVDFIRFYRVVTDNGVTTRYRLTSVANSGSPAYTDKLPLETVKAQTVLAPSLFPSSGITALGAWQNRLVIAVGPLLYLSRAGRPLEYEPQSGAYDPNSPIQGFTFYPDDKRSEDILAVVGQDDLYIVTKYSVRALVGNNPLNWRLLKLPDSEGACGPRAVCAYKKGILVLTPSGRLLYHHSSLLEPGLVSEKVHPRIGNQGIAALATSDAIVTVWPDGEIAVYSGTAYMVLDTDGNWRKGDWSHGVHSTLSVPGLAERWIGTNGKLYEGGSDSYVSDGGTTGSNGTAVTFSMTTRKYLLQRSAITSVFWGDSTESPTSGTPILPKVDLITDRGTITAIKRDGKRNVNAKVTNNGYGMKFKVYGDKNTTIETCRLELRPMAQSRQL